MAAACMVAVACASGLASSLPPHADSPTAAIAKAVASKNAQKPRGRLIGSLPALLTMFLFISAPFMVGFVVGPNYGPGLYERTFARPRRPLDRLQRPCVAPRPARRGSPRRPGGRVRSRR